MGKGGTRFVSDAVAVRAPRQRSTFSARELRRDMETYCETGVHPDIERAAQEHEERPADGPLPQFDASRPFVYLQFSVAGQSIGRITIELFSDRNPRGAEILQNRCKPGSQMSLQNSCVHTLLPECAFFVGKPRRSQEVVRCPMLNHTDRGAVSLSLDGNEVAVTMREDALALDETHQVVGRVHLGMEVLNKINDIRPGPHDFPLDEIVISSCGVTDHLGEMDVSGRKTKTDTSKAEYSVHQLKEDAQRTQTELKSALEEGLRQKRRSDVKIEKANAKKQILDHDLLSSSSSEEDA